MDDGGRMTMLLHSARRTDDWRRADEWRRLRTRHEAAPKGSPAEPARAPLVVLRRWVAQRR